MWLIWIFFIFYRKKCRKVLGITKNALPLHSQFSNMLIAKVIGIWCNGNTTDSGPVIPGSSPGIPTQNANEFHNELAFFLCLNAQMKG